MRRVQRRVDFGAGGSLGQKEDVGGKCKGLSGTMDIRKVRILEGVFEICTKIRQASCEGGDGEWSQGRR